jgi:hypothetical protein
VVANLVKFFCLVSLISVCWVFVCGEVFEFVFEFLFDMCGCLGFCLL